MYCKKNIKTKILFFIIAILILLTLTGCSKKDEEQELVGKVENEMDYIDNHLVAMLNQLNQINYDSYKLSSYTVERKEPESGKSGAEESSSTSKESSSGNSNSGSGQSSESNSDSKQVTDQITQILPNSILSNQGSADINWDALKEELYSTWTTIALDLHRLNINSEDVLAFTSQLDSVTQAVKAESKTDTLISLANLYNLIPRYVAGFTKDANKMNTINTKANVLTSYALLEEQRWEEMKPVIQKAEENFSTVLNSLNMGESKQIRVNKVYMLLKELRNSIDKKDREIFLINYKNIMQELEKI